MNQILTVREVAPPLKINVKIAYKLGAKVKFPVSRSGALWQFDRGKSRAGLNARSRNRRNRGDDRVLT